MLAGEVTKDPIVITYNLCKLLHCLPSQLDKEDAKLIAEFLIIDNELEFQKQAEAERVMSEAKRSMI